MSEIYDTIIIGAGPAGLTAGIYAAAAELKTIILESIEHVSVMRLAPEVVNYPGFKSATGAEIVDKMKEHVESMGVKIVQETVTDIINKGTVKEVRTETNIYETKTIIIATGSQHRKAQIEGEDRLFGHGVSYCATCDGIFFKGKAVAVIGGGDTALVYADYLQGIGCKVTLIHRRNEFRAQPYLIEKIKESGIELRLERTVKKIEGDKQVEAVVLDNDERIPVSAVFVAIGEVPVNSLAQKIGIALDEKGYIKVNENRETNIEGIYAAGDITTTPLRQAITAAADGAIAAMSAFKYIKSIKSKV